LGVIWVYDEVTRDVVGHVCVRVNNQLIDDEACLDEYHGDVGGEDNEDDVNNSVVIKHDDSFVFVMF